MLLGEIPGLALDRTGVALLGALVLVASERVTPAAAWAAVDVPTLALLFGLMVVSAQLRLGGFYAWVTRRIVSAEVAPAVLLAAVVGAAGALSAVLANDIVCLAVTPLLVEGCLRRKLDPLPFLLALACAANVGSAATLIGNPQNMLIGQTLRLSFAGFLADALVPAILGLAAVWLLIRLAVRGRWASEREAPTVDTPPFDAWQTAKGLAILALLVLGFLFAPVPREVLALGGAAILLMSRRMASRDLIGLVDWHLLVLFIGLFVVIAGVTRAGLDARFFELLRPIGIDSLAGLTFVGATLSNVISNVPAVMLFTSMVPRLPDPRTSWLALAMSTTLAGNLTILGSIANLIVIEGARKRGVRIPFVTHLAIGVPVTIVTLIAGTWWLHVYAR